MMSKFTTIVAVVILVVLATACCNCRATKKSRMPLVGTEWQLVQLSGESITPSDDTYTIVFGEDGRLSGVGACNRLMGSYTAGEKSSLKMGALASTRMACPGMEKESEFMQVVGSATRYDMDGTMLLLLEGDQLRAVFQARVKP